MRKLASIQQIIAIKPIEGADKIEVAQVLGWECVVAKKDQFKLGDLVVYIEIDSIVPEKEQFEFLRDRKFRVKTIKLKKQISQGLIIPISMLPKGKYREYDDVTDLLGIKKYDPQLIEENESEGSTKSKSKVVRFMMKFSWFRFIYKKLNSKEKGNWPEWIQKTDEERIQSCPRILINNMEKSWYITEKLDGQSFTCFTHKIKKWGIPRLTFGVCSRNLWLKTPHKCNYWDVAIKYDLEKKLLKLGKEIVIQGEILNTNVQGNKYKVTEPMLFVFTIVENGRRYSLSEMSEFCFNNELHMVPVVHMSYIPSAHIKATEQSDIIKEMVNYSIGKSALRNDVYREGIVCRLNDNPKISFKVINPEFLLKFD